MQHSLAILYLSFQIQLMLFWIADRFWERTTVCVDVLTCIQMMPVCGLTDKQWMWVLWLLSCVLPLSACLHLETCLVNDKNISFSCIILMNLTSCPLHPDTSLSHHLKRHLAREEWSQRPLVINAQSPTPAHYNRRSSTPLHNSKILPFTSIDYISLWPPILLWSTLFCFTW